MELKDYIPLSRLRRLVDSLKDKDPQTPITFEYLMAYCFPAIFKSVNDQINASFREGYELGKGEKCN